MKLIVIRVDGNNKIGMGHLKRQIDIAKQLIKKNYELIFLTNNFKESSSLLKKNELKFFKLKKKDQNIKKTIEELNKILTKFEKKIEIIIIDLLKYFDNQEYLDFLKKHCKYLVVFSDNSDPFYINADIVFALSQNQDEKFYKNSIKTVYYTGLKFFPLNEKYMNCKKHQIKKEVTNILLTFGGSDPQNYSNLLIKILKKINLDVIITLVIGPGFSKRNYKRLIRDLPKNIVIKRNVNDMMGYYLESDLCICSAGNTLIELLTCGVPCIVLPQTKRENDHAIVFEKKQMIINLGLDLNDEKLILEIRNLIVDYSRRESFSRNAQEYLDGRGIERVIEILLGKNSV